MGRSKAGINHEKEKSRGFLFVCFTVCEREIEELGGNTG